MGESARLRRQFGLPDREAVLVQDVSGEIGVGKVPQSTRPILRHLGADVLEQLLGSPALPLGQEVVAGNGRVGGSSLETPAVADGAVGGVLLHAPPGLFRCKPPLLLTGSGRLCLLLT